MLNDWKRVTGFYEKVQEKVSKFQIHPMLKEANFFIGLMILFTLIWYGVLYLKKHFYKRDQLLDNEEGNTKSSRWQQFFLFKVWFFSKINHGLLLQRKIIFKAPSWDKWYNPLKCLRILSVFQLYLIIYMCSAYAIF